MIVLRSLAYNLLFYVVMAGYLVVLLPVALLLPVRGSMVLVRTLARILLWLQRWVAGTRREFRGVENLPDGPFLLAGKHQSLWETFGILDVLVYPAFVMKRDLARVPVWGWWAWKEDSIFVSRGAGTSALREIAEGGQRAVEQGRPIVIFPEGTRRPPGAPADYKVGIAHLYGKLGVPVVPMALNSGFYWPRRKFLRYPGRIVVEFLPPIPPGLAARTFLNRLVAETEAACDRLILEADADHPRPPFPPEAEKRLSELNSQIVPAG
jgi:1-acyl-sn-glycerol-3-phosphate acyltransferase